jgi:hypothetical protein
VLTGSEAISYRQAAQIIGTVIGKNVRFVDESPEEARARRVREGVPPAVIESILAIGAYQRVGGKTVTITNTVAGSLAGRHEPMPSSYANTHRSSASSRARLLLPRSSRCFVHTPGCSIPR